MATQFEILQLVKQLYPTGRAFKHNKGTDAYKYQNGRAAVYADAFDDAVAVLNAILPDNDGFTSADATRWEQRLGMIVNESVPLSDRKQAIQQKMNHPGEIPARQSADYLQAQLQAAGFDLYVYQNTLAVYPDYYDPSGLTEWEHGQWEHGELQHGAAWGDVVYNNLDYTKDIPFSYRTVLTGTFFVGGPTIGSFANVSEDRREELRRLILQLKPCEALGFLFITYTY